MYCPNCGKEIQLDTYSNYCPSCGQTLSEDLLEARKQIIVKLAKFNLPSEIVFESCIASVDNLGLTIDKIDRVSKYIEAVDGKMALKDKRTVFHLKVAEAQSKATSVIRVTITSEDTGVATELFNRLIDILRSKLNQEPTSVENEKASETKTQDKSSTFHLQADRRESSKVGRKGSIVLGIIVAIWTIFFVGIMIDYSIRLASVTENVSGLGTLVI